MTDADGHSAASELASEVRDQVAALERELAEIDMLVGQARAEAARHEQKRVAATSRRRPPIATRVSVMDGQSETTRRGLTA